MLEDLKILIVHFISVTDSLRGKQSDDEWIIYAEGCAKKLFGHVSSIFSLYQGITLKIDGNRQAQFIDHSSINVLTRSTFENALAFHFIFCEAPTIEEKKFRFTCWDYSGFLERQGFPVSSNENISLKQKESEEMNILKQQIISNSIFQSFKKDLQNKILLRHDGWRLNNSWTQIGENAGFEKKSFDSIYSLLCGYSHTGRLSVLQVMEAKDIEVQRELADSNIGLCCIIISNMLFWYSALFQEAEKSFKTLEYPFEKAKMWRNIGRNIGETILL